MRQVPNYLDASLILRVFLHLCASHSTRSESACHHKFGSSWHRYDLGVGYVLWMADAVSNNYIVIQLHLSRGEIIYLNEESLGSQKQVY